MTDSANTLNTMGWAEAIAMLSKWGKSFVIVTVLNKRGSAPREAGTKMVVSQDAFYATIGGGNLELQAIEQARDLLNKGEEAQTIIDYPLCARTSQCCGGSVQLLYEAIVVSALQLDVYGAGHVGHALMQVLPDLPVTIRWIDARADLFPANLPNNVTPIVAAQPELEVQQAPANSAFLVLTHDHGLDYAICKSVLQRDAVRWFGVIGSRTKAARFAYKLKQDGFSQQQIETMHCPVGIDQVQGKRPMEIGVSIAAQLIDLYQHHDVQVAERSNLTTSTETRSKNDTTDA